MSHRQQLRAVAQMAPGFEGVFVDQNGAATLAVATDDFPVARQALVVQWARQYFRGLDLSTPVRLQRVAYDYAQLFDGFATVQQSVQRGDGVTLLAIDETKAVIRVGLASLAQTAALRARLVTAGIPSDMLQFEQDDIGVADATLQSNGVRPAVGGLEILSHETLACSIGFNVMRWDTGTDPMTSPKYLLTAAHCAGTTWGVNKSLPYSQVSAAGYQIGAEYEAVPIVNYPAWQCPNSTESPCELADVLVLKYDDTVSVGYGNVANVDGSLNIIGYYNVQGMTGFTPGQTVTKVGAFGGKSTGTIHASCVDRLFGVPGVHANIWVPCQGEATYSASDGDSGAPIFIPGSSPVMIGVHSNHGSTYRYFSTMDQIDLALNSAYYYQ
jgi:hypothetical protein